MLPKYCVDQKVRSGFSVQPTEKNQMKFLANTILRKVCNLQAPATRGRTSQTSSRLPSPCPARPSSLYSRSILNLPIAKLKFCSLPTLSALSKKPSPGLQPLSSFHSHPTQQAPLIRSPALTDPETQASSDLTTARG